MHGIEAPTEMPGPTAGAPRDLWSLSTLIRNAAHRIAGEWLESLAPDAMASTGLPGLGQATRLVLAIADDMDRLRCLEDDFAEGVQTVQAGTTGLLTAARHHAADRLRRNLNLTRLYAEYGQLRAVIMHHVERGPAPQSAELDELARFDHTLDRCRLEAVTWYERQLEIRHQLVTGLLGHELRDPLNMITLTADALDRTEPMPSDELRTAAERLRRSAQHMKVMVNDLLSFSTVQSDRGLPVNRRPTHLEALSSAIASDLALQHPGETLSFSCQGGGLAMIDPDRFEQLVCNLTTNAIKFKSPGSVVSVSVERRADGVRVTVHNEGEPIPREFQRVLFDPFVRDVVDGSRRGGIGLGLFVCSEIARAHGGAVTVTSTREAGTTFSAVLREPPG